MVFSGSGSGTGMGRWGVGGPNYGTRGTLLPLSRVFVRAAVTACGVRALGSRLGARRVRLVSCYRLTAPASCRSFESIFKSIDDAEGISKGSFILLDTPRF